MNATTQPEQTPGLPRLDGRYVKQKKRQTLHDSLIADILKDIIRYEGKCSCTHFLTINREITKELYVAFYKDLVISNRETLELLIRTLECSPSKTTLPKSLYIQIGCTSNVVSANRHPACPRYNTLLCRLKDKGTCLHLRDADTERLHRLAELCSSTITTFILHSNRPVPTAWKILHNLTFPEVTDVEAPVEALESRTPVVPFPCVRCMRLSILSEPTARRLVGQHNFRPYYHLQRLLLSFWDVREDTTERIIDHLRVPANIVSVGVENDRVVMSPEGLDILFDRWESYLQTSLTRRPIALEDVLDNAFTVSSCEGGDAIWLQMDVQLQRKNRLLQGRALSNVP
ncbi:hypothetical protein VNI00_016214 [Paramarasmius palmivorus]|uniref:Uncharacterized protein n=1 Tax=Paramarasmius palmivorus TaxID=297713 RepID=A0AAW0BEN7_9AGAR